MKAFWGTLLVHGKVRAIALDLAVLGKIDQELRALGQMLQGFTWHISHLGRGRETYLGSVVENLNLKLKAWEIFAHILKLSMSQFFTSRKLAEQALNGSFGAFIRICTFVPPIKPKRRFLEKFFGERAPKVFPILNSQVCTVYFQNSPKIAGFSIMRHFISRVRVETVEIRGNVGLKLRVLGWPSILNFEFAPL